MVGYKLTASANPPAKLALLDELGVFLPLSSTPPVDNPFTEVKLTPLSLGAGGAAGLFRTPVGLLAGGAGGVGFALVLVLPTVMAGIRLAVPLACC